MLRLSMPSVRFRAGSRPSFTRLGVALLAGAAVVGSLALATPAHAAEAPGPDNTITTASVQQLGYQLKAGPKLKKMSGFKTEWLGTLATGGKLGFCFDYGLAAPDGGWTSGPIPGVKGRARTVAQYAANAHWDDAAGSKRAAAALKSTINRAVSADFRADWAASYVPQLKRIDADVIALSDRWLAEAQAVAGSVKATVTSTHPGPGSAGIITVKATGNGHALPGAAVAWKVTGAKVTASSKGTSATGTATLRFIRGAGPVSYAAVIRSADSSKAAWSQPSKGRQHLIRGGFTIGTRVAGKFDSLAGVTVESTCDSTCDGRPPVSFSAKASGSPVRWQAVDGGKVVKTLSLGAGKSGRATFTGVDGQRLVLRYQVKVAGKWGGWRNARTFDVVCPAWPKVVMTKSCPCKGNPSVTYTFTSPGGARVYDVSLSGQTKRIGGTRSVSLTLPVKRGTNVIAGFTAYDQAGKRLSGGVLDAWTQN